MNDHGGKQRCWLCALRQRCSLAGLLREAGLEAGVETDLVEYPAGTVFQVPAGKVCALRSGAVKVLWDEAPKRPRVIDFRFAGEFVGLDSSLGVEDDKRSYETLQWTRLCTLRQASAGAELPPALLAARLAGSIMPVYAHNRMMQAGARQRVACYLVRALDALEQGGGLRPGILPPVSRADIAEYLGLRAESVSRALGQFRQAGWISGKVDSIEILRAEPLRALVASAR